MATKRSYKELEQRLKEAESAAARAEQAEERFYAASERLEYLLSSTSAVIYTARPEGEYSTTFISSNVTDMVGYSPREFTESPGFWLAHIHPEDQTLVVEEMKNLLESGAHTYEHRFLRKNGTPIWVRNQMKLIRDKAGKPIEIVGYWADITELKQTEERVRKVSCLRDRLLGTMSLEEKLKVVTNGVVEIIRADFARIWMIGAGDWCEKGCPHAMVTEGPHLCRDRSQCLHLIAGSGRYTHLDGGHRRVPFGCYKIGRVASGEEPGFITNDVTHDPRVHDHEWAKSLGLVSFAGYRLISPERNPIGVLALFSTHTVGPDENALLEDLASSTSQLILTGMMEEALRESELRYRTLFESAHDAIFIMQGSRVIDCNEQTTQMFGCRPEELIGRRPCELSPERQAGGTLSIEAGAERIRAAYAGTPQFFEWQHRRLDGEVFYAEVSLKRLHAGEKPLLQAIVRDITERKHLENALTLTQLSVDKAADGVQWIAPDGRFIYVNEEACRSLGYSREELLGMSVWDINPERTPGLFRTRWKTIKEHKSWLFETQHRAKDGRVFPVEISGKYLAFGDREYYFAFVRDITDRKEDEEALRKSEERVRALNDEILNMLMVVSHDIRSPLVSIAATLKLLYKGVYGKIDESVKNTVNDLLARINRLSGTAEDFLGKAAVVKGTIDMEHRLLDMRADIIDPVLEEFSPDIEAQEITIDNRLGAIPADRIRVRANRIWLRTVFRNLFANALKYGGKGCRIAFGFQELDSYYQFNVYNSGEPVPMDHRDNLFDKFYRIQTPYQNKAKGMGLGLYLVKEIITKHGGDIWYEAKEDGSNFVFTLPRE